MFGRTYPANYRKTLNRANCERIQNDPPELEMLSQYDTIYLGYQTWAMTLSQPMRALLLEYGGEFSNKKIAPFLSEGGYGSGDSTELIREFIARDGGKNNTYASALIVDGNRVDESDVEVKRWLKTI